MGDYASAIILKRPDSLGLFAAWGYLERVPGFPVVQLSRSANMKSPNILLSLVAAVTMTFGLEPPQICWTLRIGGGHLRARPARHRAVA